MAYVDTYRSRNRPAVIAVVAALHVAAGYALVTGLAASIVPIIKDPFVSTFVPMDPPKPPPPAPQPSAKPADTPVTVTRTPYAMPSAAPSFTPGPVATSAAVDDGIDIAAFPTPTPTFSPPAPRFLPKAATPLGNPARWVSPDDYPPGELRRGHEGITKFKLTIGSDGRVMNCAVTGSSGWPLLDAAACAKLTARGKFKPATDETGAVVSGTYSSSMLWDIPDE